MIYTSNSKTWTSRCSGNWLEEELLVFHFAELKDLDTGSEELFIKMNARGKQLTEFEHLKARLLNSPRVKRGATSEQLKNLEKKLDTDWQELFWHISKNRKTGLWKRMPPLSAF